MAPPPYPLTFVPAPTVFGAAPGILTDTISAPARISLNVAANLGADSGTFFTRSFGIVVPGGLRGTSRLFVSALFRWSGTFFTTGLFASARTFAHVRIFVENFDSVRGTFLGSVFGPEKNLFSQSFWYAAGSDTTTLATRSDFISGPVPVTSTDTHRVWFDLTVYVGAAGFAPGRTGGSNAAATVIVLVDDISASRF